MPSIMSPISEIDEIHFESLKSGVVIKDIKAAIRVDDVTIFMDAKGRLFWPGQKDYCFAPGNWRWNKPMMNALVKLGAITRKQADDHIKAMEECSKFREKNSDFEQIERLCKKYGFHVPAVVKDRK